MPKNPTVAPQQATYFPEPLMPKANVPGRHTTMTDPAPYGFDMPKDRMPDEPLHDPKVESMPISFEAAERGTGR